MHFCEKTRFWRGIQLDLELARCRRTFQRREQCGAFHTGDGRRCRGIERPSFIIQLSTALGGVHVFSRSRRQWRCSRRPRSTIASNIPSAAATMSSSSTASSTTDNNPSDRGRPRRRLLSADVPQASAAENGGEVSVAKGVGALPCVDTGPPNTAASIRLAKKWLAGHPVPLRSAQLCTPKLAPPPLRPLPPISQPRESR